MTEYTLRVTFAARADMDAAVVTSEANFGPSAAARYRALIERALEAVRSNPNRPAALPRPELGPAVKSFHLMHARKLAPRVRRPRHLLLFRLVAPVMIVGDRMLHDAMDIALHLPQADADKDE